jgi:hypothetical protein
MPQYRRWVGNFRRTAGLSPLVPRGESSDSLSLSDFGAGNIYALSFVRVGWFCTRSDFRDCPRPMVRSLSAIAYIVFTSLLRLDREALPLTISFADGVLIRKLFVKSLTKSLSPWHSDHSCSRPSFSAPKSDPAHKTFTPQSLYIYKKICYNDL